MNCKSSSSHLSCLHCSCRGCSTKVHKSVDPFPSATWKTCATWDEAVRLWDSARRAGSIKLLRAGEGQNSATASTVGRASPPSPSPVGVRRRGPASRATHTALSKTRFTSNKTRRAAGNQTKPTKPQEQPDTVIIISDSDNNDGSVRDSEVETTSPKPIKKLIDCYEWSEGEDGSGYFRKTYDAVTETFLDKPVKPQNSFREKMAPFSPVASGSAHPDSALVPIPSRHTKSKSSQAPARKKGGPQRKPM